MRIIEYVEKIFKGVDVTSEVKLQKEELLDHLNDKVSDLVNEGYFIEDAEKKVIEDFGSIESVRKELNLEIVQDDLTNKLKTLYWCGYISLILVLVSFEFYFLIHHFFYNQMAALGTFIGLNTIGVLLIIFIETQIVLLPKIDEFHFKLFKTIYRLVLMTLGVLLIGLTFIIPLISQDTFLIQTYLFDAFSYLMISAFVFVLLGYKIETFYNQKMSLDVKSDFIGKVIHSKWTMKYGYIIVLMYLFFIFGNHTSRLLLVFWLSLIGQIIYDIFQYKKHQEKINMIRPIYAFFMIISMTIKFHQVASVLAFVSFIGIIYLLVYYFIIKKRREQLTFMTVFISYLPIFIFQAFIFLNIATIHYGLDEINISTTIQLNIPLISLGVMIYLFVKFLYVHLGINQEEHYFTKLNQVKLKRLFYIIPILTVLLILQIPQRVFYKQLIEQRFNEGIVKEFSFKSGYEMNDKPIIVTSFRENDSYCLGYQQVHIGLLFFAQSNSGTFSGQCYGGSVPLGIEVTNNSFNYGTSDQNPYLNLVVYGLNDYKYKEYILYYKWGSVVHVPIDDTDTFFYHQKVEVPDEYINDVFSPDVVTIEKVRR